MDDSRVFRKVAWRLLPILTIAYVFNYLDRNNIGFAALTMNREIGLTATAVRPGRGDVVRRLLLPRSPEQHDAVPRRRTGSGSRGS